MVLQTLRSKKFAKRVLIVLLILIIPAFVLWGVGNISSRPGPVGQIGGRKISAENFAESRQGIKIQILFSYYSNIDALNKILQNRSLINFMAWERLMLLHALKNENIKIPNEDVISFLAQHPIFQRKGVFDKEVYNYILRNNLSMAPRQFEELVRENLKIQAFRYSILKDVSVSDEELLDAYKKGNDKVDISYILIEKDSFANEVRTSDKEVRDFYEVNKENFFEPAKVNVEYIEFPYGNSKERDSVLRKIEKIYSELAEDPSKFAEIAGHYGIVHGETGPFSRDQVIPGITFFNEFHDTAFFLEEGEISSPIFSSPEKGVAYILLKTMDIPRKPLDFKNAREDIITALKDEKSLGLAKRSADELYEKISSGEITLDEAAKDTRTKIKSTGDISIGGYIENIGPASEIVLLALETDQGKIMSPVITKKGVFLGDLKKILPASEIEFEANKEKLRENLLNRKRMAVMDNWFRENQENVKLNKPLEEL